MSKEKEKKKEESPQEKKSRTLKFIIFVGVLIIILLGLVFIPKFINKAKLENNKYNEFEFVQQDDGFWYTLVQKGPQPYWIPFYYHPSDLEDIPVDPNLRSKFFEIAENNGIIFITLDPDAGNNTIVIAGVEISKITGTRYDLLNVPTKSAFIRPPTSASADTGTPIVTCNHANNKTLVIWLTISHSNIAYSYDYCVRLEATDYENMIRVADRTMYHLLGIMD